MDMLKLPNTEEIINKPQVDSFSQIPPKLQTPTIYKPFDISVFHKELQSKSSIKNKLYRETSENINAYDISTNCIMDIVYKLSNRPVECFADKWLPILLRGTIGTAIHEFIQTNSDQFTENEISIKIPSIRFSGRMDNLIGPEILVEIKSCPYVEYQKIIKSKKPRPADFYQAITYKYILKNYLTEAKNPSIKIREGSRKPNLDYYDIRKVQFIYVAHDITATDVESFAEMIQRVKDIKKALNSKSDSFFFMTTLVVDIPDEISKPYEDYIEQKIKRINWYLDNNKFPLNDDPYIDKTKCYFCLYKKNCDLLK
jgi:hypothetical protein